MFLSLKLTCTSVTAMLQTGKEINTYYILWFILLTRSHYKNVAEVRDLHVCRAPNIIQLVVSYIYISLCAIYHILGFCRTLNVQISNCLMRQRSSISTLSPPQLSFCSSLTLNPRRNKEIDKVSTNAERDKQVTRHRNTALRSVSVHCPKNPLQLYEYIFL